MAKKRFNQRTNKIMDYDEFFESIGGSTMDSRLAQTDTAGIKSGVSAVMGLFALALGISGLIPALAPNNLVWGLFRVDAVHNAIHLIAGAGALYAAYKLDAAKAIWKGTAIVFGILAVAGIFTGQGEALGVVPNNPADTWLHIGKTAVFAWLGWSAWNRD